jgi:hypothetical protein
MEVLTKYGEICEASFDMDFGPRMDQVGRPPGQGMAAPARHPRHGL